MTDSLTYHYPGAMLGTKTIAATPADIFGDASYTHETTAAQPFPVRYGGTAAVNIYVLDGLLLALFLFYVFVVFRFRDGIAFLLKAVTGVMPVNAVVTYNNMHFRLFVDVAGVMGAVACAALLLAFYIACGGKSDYAPAAICAALTLIYIYRKTLLAAISRLSTDRSFVHDAALFARVIFALAALFAAPLVMASGYFSENRYNIFWVIMAIVLIVLVLYYLIKNLGFFAAGKVSVLQWFLYLCAVEILPVSFFVLLLLRNHNI